MIRDETPAPIFIRFNFRYGLGPLGFFQGRPSLVRCPTGFFPRSGCHDAHRGFPPPDRRDRLEASSPSGLGPGLLCTQGSRSLDQLERSPAGRSPQTHRPEPPVADPFTQRCCPQSGIPSNGCGTQGPSSPMVGSLRLPTAPGRELHRSRGLRRNHLQGHQLATLRHYPRLRPKSPRRPPPTHCTASARSPGPSPIKAAIISCRSKATNPIWRNRPNRGRRLRIPLF